MSLRRFFRRAQWDRERSEEIEFYLRIETDENVARGLPYHEAQTAALRKFGNRTVVREEIYRMNTMTFLDTLVGDVRYGLRMLVRSPMSTAAALLTLAIGLGANAAVFSVVKRAAAAITLSQGRATGRPSSRRARSSGTGECRRRTGSVAIDVFHLRRAEPDIPGARRVDSGDGECHEPGRAGASPHGFCQ